MIPHASHLFTTDQPEAAHHAILEFLNQRTGSARSADRLEKEKASC
jgi:hypothetical protein